MSSKTLLIDGTWNFKRNFKKQNSLKSTTGNLCGGTVGFLFSLKAVINKILPDRVVVAWDGYHAGKFRYDIYKPYKISRGQNFASEDRAIMTGGAESPKAMEMYEMTRQKIILQNILDELFIRQMECDYVEADDLIAQYILRSENDDEQIYIYSRDGDFPQLVSDKVKVITPDCVWVFDKEQYEKKFGHIVENELLMKCFEGDDADDISGVIGVTREKLMEYFPAIKTEKYSYGRLVEECYEAKKDKKIGKRKIYDKIIGAEEILYRNAKLMNLKKPFLSYEAIGLVDTVKHAVLDDTREIKSAMDLFREEGLMYHVGEQYADSFFSAFYMIMTKEKEYAKKMKI